ncbi:hypothetical protein VB716_15580 [Synechococcus sp. CCY9201]|uniref:hypothetical protein n=1 Tax=unclassified Synechococcus TaxID=2626047 RepID=UPI0018CE9EF1|nr:MULTISPECIES: hypothetical protein [unclassified Synechococcus]MEA5475640.1 hypothetical protein [Synechococcus sp. CCY9201]QPN68759.1 hypothetical protein H8F26_14075 [Synechococcus sp. CBW1006]
MARFRSADSDSAPPSPRPPSSRWRLLSRRSGVGAGLLLAGLWGLANLAGRAAASPATPDDAPQLLAGSLLFQLIVQGSIVGLLAATLILVGIWLHELRHGRVW